MALALACGPSTSSPQDSAAQTCSSFSCTQLSSCSSLSQAQCDGLCECFPDRWAPAAFSAFAACASQCKNIGDTYSTCVVEASAQQATFVNPQYIANCDIKRSVCASYATDACNPVILALLSPESFDDLTGCLALDCGGPAESCVADVLYCGSPPP